MFGPTTCYEVLENIFAELMADKDYDNAEKFMLTGYESFQASLSYLRRAKKVVISEKVFHVEFKKQPRLTIPYKLRFIKPILDAAAYGLEEIIICRRPEWEYRDYVLGVMIERYCNDNKLRKIVIWETLAYKWYTAIRNRPGIQEIHLSYADTLFGFAMISSSCKKIDLHYMDFKTLNHCFVASYISVEHLSIDGPFELNDIQGSALYDVFTFISQSFPNLKTLKVSFTCSTSDYKPNMYSMMAKINDSMFDELLLSVKGSIVFKAKCQLALFVTVINGISSDSDVSIDYIKKSFTKEFMVQDELSFKCEVNFN